MERSADLALNEFMELTGHHQLKLTKNELNDFGVILDDKIKFFICNGSMNDFERNLKSYLRDYKTAMSCRKKHIAWLQEQINYDNKVALSENLHTVELVDVDVNTENEQKFLWPYAKLKVDGREIKLVETALCNAIRADNLLAWSAKCRRPVFTAGGVKQPDFIFGNVRFSSTDTLYKI